MEVNAYEACVATYVSSVGISTRFIIKMQFYKRILILCLCIFFKLSDSGYALPQDINLTQCRLDTWSVRDGLSGETINQITQSPDGYIWLATSGGLVRFDGSQFQIYNSSNLRKLTNDSFNTLLIDNRKQFWTGGNWLGYGILKDNVYEHKGPDAKEWHTVNHIEQTSDGSIWIGGLGIGGVYRYKGAKRTIIPELADGVMGFCDVGAGKVMVLMYNAGCRIVDSANRVTNYPLQKNLPTDSFRRVLKTRSNEFWFATTHIGAARVIGNKVINYTTKDGLPSNTINCIYEDKNSRIWLGTPDGVSVWNGRTFINFGKNDGLPSSEITAIYEDREGNLWVGADTFLCRFAATKIQSTNLHYGTRNVKISQYSSIAELTKPLIQSGRGAHILCATEHGLCYIYPDGYKFFGYPFDKDTYGVCAGPDNIVWIWGVDDNKSFLWSLSIEDLKDLIKTEGKDNKIVQRVLKKRIYTDKYIHLAVAIKKELIAIADNDEIVRYRIGKPVQKFKCRFGWGFYFKNDPNGDYWLGSTLGLLKISHNLKSSSLFNWNSAHFLGFDVSNPNCIWLASDKGLLRYENGKVHLYDTKAGLVTNDLYHLQIDKNGIIWLGYRTGISAIKIDDIHAYDKKEIPKLPVKSYTLSDGLGTHNNSFMSLTSSDKTIWFVGESTLSSINPLHVQINNQLPPIRINKAAVDNVKIIGGRLNTIPAGPGNFTVNYAALTYIAHEKVIFRYKLLGIDKDWIETKEHKASYMNLPPGRYKFLVIGSNNDGVWNTFGTSIEFEIAPHYYQTIWFTILIAISMVLLIYGIVQVRIRSINRRNAELENLVTLKTQELRASNQELEAQNQVLIQVSNELTAANEKLSELAVTDGLTGLHNHRAFQEQLSKEWQRIQRSYESLSVILMDVDYFKKYNDTFGHPEGDNVLRAIAEIITKTLRATDFAARYGGEEFIVIAPDTGPEGAKQLAERIREAVEHYEWPYRSITMSVGIATTSASMANSTDLIAEADSALYASKAIGRNRTTHALDNRSLR